MYTLTLTLLNISVDVFRLPGKPALKPLTGVHANECSTNINSTGKLLAVLDSCLHDGIYSKVLALVFGGYFTCCYTTVVFTSQLIACINYYCSDDI